MTWPPKNDQLTNYTEEPVTMVCKEHLTLLWAGAKAMYSGIHGSSDANNSGYWFESGDVDVQPISDSGWGRIRVPELSEVHFALIAPKQPCVNARVDYLTGSAASGVGGCSGNVILVHYCGIFDLSGIVTSGLPHWVSGGNLFTSGIVDILAIGSKN